MQWADGMETDLANHERQAKMAAMILGQHDKETWFSKAQLNACKKGADKIEAKVAKVMMLKSMHAMSPDAAFEGAKLKAEKDPSVVGLRSLLLVPQALPLSL